MMCILEPETQTKTCSRLGVEVIGDEAIKYDRIHEIFEFHLLKACNIIGDRYLYTCRHRVNVPYVILYDTISTQSIDLLLNTGTLIENQRWE